MILTVVMIYLISYLKQIYLLSFIFKANLEDPVNLNVSTQSPQRLTSRPPMSLPPMSIPPPDADWEDAFYLPSPSNVDPVTGEYDQRMGPRRRVVKDSVEYFEKHQASTSSSNIYR